MLDKKDMIIEYCKGNMDGTRAMWDEIFADPKEFADYYFEDICRNNKILTAFYKGTAVGMLHLNPYRVSVCGKIMTCYYIVGVAVKEDMRRQGIMRIMLEKALEDMRAEGCAFTFLMPKRKEYYSGMGFNMICHTNILEYDIPENDRIKELIENNRSFGELRLLMLSGYDLHGLDRLGAEINNLLAAKYNAFSVRDREYLTRMVNEHLCQNGDVCVVYGEGLAGLFSYDIYDNVMYVERLEILNTDADNMLALIRRFAADKSCLRCVITVHGYHPGLSGREGHGIMAYVFDNSYNISVDLLANNSFFDEIV